MDEKELDPLRYFDEYMTLRQRCSLPRFFLNIAFNKTTFKNQPTGKNKIASFPRKVAKFNKLDDPMSYRGHCFRRTAATWAVENGADLNLLKRLGDWKSTSVAEDYVHNSMMFKRKLSETVFPAEKRLKPEADDVEEATHKMIKVKNLEVREGENLSKISLTSPTLKLCKTPLNQPQIRNTDSEHRKRLGGCERT